MKSKNQLLKDALLLAKSNIIPSKELFDICYINLSKICKKYNADETLTTIGLCLMDIKLGEAIDKNMLNMHVKMSSDFAKKFLKDYDLTKEETEKIINCIEAHHKDISFSCIEAEICANLDCYRFIHPVGVLAYANILNEAKLSMKNQTIELKKKLKEKHDILSLDYVKQELEHYYLEYEKQFDEILKTVEKE